MNPLYFKYNVYTHFKTQFFFFFFIIRSNLIFVLLLFELRRVLAGAALFVNLN